MKTPPRCERGAALFIYSSIGISSGTLRSAIEYGLPLPLGLPYTRRPILVNDDAATASLFSLLFVVYAWPMTLHLLRRRSTLLSFCCLLLCWLTLNN